MMSEYFAVIEAGGTKFNCAVVDASRRIMAEQRIATTTPEETLGKTVQFFKDCTVKGFRFNKMGIGSFGPLDLNTASPAFGHITATPKPYWSNTPLVSYLSNALDCEINIDTDVNAAALGEYRWGAAQNCSVVIYITVGTGVGGGVVINGKPLHGLIHPEIGHMHIGEIEDIQGACPFHGSCVEGMASGTSMAKIWQTDAAQLPQEHRAWDIEARVLARLCHNLMVSFSPQKIVLGGGVMQQPFLLPVVQKYTLKSLADYVQFPTGTDITDIIVRPGLQDKSGLFGALALIN
jgi:fructokinase